MPGRGEQDPDRQDAVRQVNPSGPRGPEDPMTESFQQLFEQPVIVGLYCVRQQIEAHIA